MGKVSHCLPQLTQCVKAACPAPLRSTAAGTSQPVASVMAPHHQSLMSCTRAVCLCGYKMTWPHYLLKTASARNVFAIRESLNAMHCKLSSYNNHAELQALTAAMYSSTVLYDTHCLSTESQNGMYPRTCSPRTLAADLVVLRVCVHYCTSGSHRSSQDSAARPVTMCWQRIHIQAALPSMLTSCINLAACHVTCTLHALVLCC